MARRKSSFQDRLALITGGSSGIGLSLAQLLVQEGAHVWLLARNERKLEGVFAALSLSSDQRSGYVCADVADWEQTQSAVATVIDEAGVPDLLINSAGIAYPGYVQEIPVEAFHEVMDINYFGTVHSVKALLPHLLDRGSGHIVNISSVAGYLGVFGYSAYGASKYAVRGFSDVLRSEVRPLGVRVSIVFPPDTDTPQLAYDREHEPEETRILSGKAGALSPRQVAKTILRCVERGQYAITPGLETSIIYRLGGFLGKAAYPIMDILVSQAIRKKSKSEVSGKAR